MILRLSSSLNRQLNNKNYISFDYQPALLLWAGCF
jgi:hypothetical protein